jgi:hypothetical protein
MFAFYLIGYAAVAGLFYYRAYHTAPLMEEAESPLLTLWVNPEMAEEPETWRKAA